MATPITSSTSTAPQTTSGSSSSSNNDPLAGMNVSSFINLMIAELQNQDPLNPMDNSQMMQELGQLQTIESSQKLTTTLNSVLQGQSFSTAASLIGKNIDGLDDNSNPVTGTVGSVTVTGGDVKLQVGDATVSLDNVSQILPSTTGQ